MQKLTYQSPTAEQFEAAIQLLETNNLPTADIRSPQVAMLVALAGDAVVGCIGMEAASPFGLLRSMAVEEQYRGRGIAQALCDLVLQEAVRRGYEGVFAMTMEADGFFVKKGFALQPRESVPAPIRATAQFSSLCPQSAKVLYRASGSNST